jgi:phosphoglycerol transferase MdoB-like AlkP superfamily enzyme
LADLSALQRIRPLLILAGLGWVMFAVFRAVLLIARHRFLAGASADLLDCFLVGMRFDAVPIGYAELPLALVLSLAPGEAFARKTFRRGVVAYAATLVTLALVTEVIGACFFLHFGYRLNWLAIAHWGHFRESAVYIWNAYPVWLLAILIVIVFLAFRGIFARAFWRGGSPHQVRLIPRAALAVITAGICIVACRGGLDHRPLEQNSAYFAVNKIVNQLTMNNFFTLFHAARSNINPADDEKDLYYFPPPARAAEVASGLLIQPGQTPLGDAANPLWRRSDTAMPRHDYNVVVILMEGMAGQPVGILGYGPSYTPNLDALCKDGIFFDRMYAVGCRTSRGVVGVLCGHPDIGGLSVLKRDLAQGNFLTLPSLFRGRGYETFFLYGGDPGFDNMQGFFAQAGMDHFYTQNDMGSPQEVGNWGVPDELIFAKAHEVFQNAGNHRFFGFILTVSNHPPFEIPPGRIEALPGDSEQTKSLNAYRYADWALGRFFDQARQAAYFKNTVFVLVSDHGRDFDQGRLVDVPGYRIPCLIYAPGILAPRRVSTVASQVDIAPTILALLGGTYEHCFLGRDVLAVEEGQGFAVLHDEDRFAMVRGDFALVVSPKNEEAIFRVGPDSMKAEAITPANKPDAGMMKLQLLSYYQMARHLYLTCAYRPPDSSAVTMRKARELSGEVNQHP